nr:hypothetical protein [uncultured bacterium]
MNVILFSKLMLILRVAFLFYFGRELYLSSFKNPKYKVVWFLIVLVFPIYGYSVYLSIRRRLLKKRVFNPMFNTIK